MLPKNRRISRKEIPDILKYGHRFASPHLLLYAFKKENAGRSQFSFSISKKIHTHAVDRNMYRRRGYAVVEKNLPEITSHFLCFFVFKKGIYPISFNLLQKEVKELLTSSGVV